MWWWVLIWVLLVLVAAAYLAGRLWSLWGQVKELMAETERATQTLSALELEVERLGDRAATLPLAVFEDPRELRRHRRTTAAALRGQRAARRAGRLPRWARDVD